MAMDFQEMIFEADEGTNDMPDLLSFMSMNMKDTDSAGLKAADRLFSCNERITNMAKADEHFTVFLTEHTYFLNALLTSPRSRSYFNPHDTAIFGKKKSLERVINIFSDSNPIYAPLVHLKKYLKDECGLCFVSGDSLAGNLALLSLLADHIEVHALYFFGVVAVRSVRPRQQPWFVENILDVDNYAFIYDYDHNCYRRAPHLLHKMIDFDKRAVQNMPGKFVFLIDPKGMRKEELEIVESVLGIEKDKKEETVPGKNKVIRQLNQKKIRRSIRDYAQSPSYPNLKDLLKHVMGECGLIYVQGGNSELTFLLQNVMVRALYIPGFVFPRASLYLTWSKLQNEIPIPYKEIEIQTEISIGSLVVNILQVSNDPGGLLKFHVILKQAHFMLQVEPIELLTLLDQLNPFVNSLGYLYFMEACTSAAISMEQASAVVKRTAKFIDVCDKEQIQMAPEKFIRVCRWFKDQVMQLQCPLRGVAPILKAIRKIQKSVEHFTALHPDYLDLCLLSKCYKAGLSILEEDLFEIDQPKDHLLYCYYGAMIHIKQKSFGEALNLLHQVLTAPVPDMNAIAVEAYKKYILVSLVHSGQFSTSFPKYTTSIAQRSLNSFCQPYIEFANKWNTGKVAVEAVAQKHRESFKKDKNHGLVKQAISSIYKHKIQRLSQIYMTLSLQDLANRVQLTGAREAEMHVLQMIQDGEIFGSINQKDGVVSFLDDPELVKSEHICSSMQRITGLSRKLSSMNEDFSCDPPFLGAEEESLVYTAEWLGPRTWIM